MLENLPLYIPVVFILTTFIAVLLFYKATFKSRVVLLLLFSWLAIQLILGWNRFYTVTQSLPPRFLLLIGPPLLFIILLFTTPAGRQFTNHLNPRWLTYLHTIRIPVEVVLLWLFMQGYLPKVMTFEGRNFDMVAGITAPFVAYFGYQKGMLNKPLLLTWNFISLALLLNIVVHAVLSAPFPFQQLAFDHPNVAILYFPFIWLPGGIVPLVLLSHLVCIRQLLKKRKPATPR